MVTTVSADTLRINLGEDTHDIVIGVNLAERMAQDLKEKNYGFKYAVITDSHVMREQVKPISNALRNAGLNFDVFDFPEGEASKRWSTIESLDEQLAQKGYGRDSVLIAVGGGVTTDMVGLYASALCRGVPCILYPTSTAAQGDAAIGGKTGVNSRWAKNRFGDFKQPKGVYIDVATLKTLPNREYNEGAAEWVKHGEIRDAKYFGFLEQNVDAILARDEKTLIHIAKQNVLIKGTVVEQDEEEGGLRQILNRGHTIGHALESLSGYKKLLHGEAVSIGMYAEGLMAVEMGLYSSEDLARVEALLKRFGLPTRIPKEFPEEAILKAAVLDKKARGGHPRYALPRQIGEMCEFGGEYATRIPDEIVIKALREAR